MTAVDPLFARNALRHFPLLDGSTPPRTLLVDAGITVDQDCDLVPSSDTVDLTRIERVVGGYVITLTCTAAVDGPLTFAVSDGWGEWATVWSSPFGSSSSGVPSAPSWFGFLVLGRESDWQAYLPSGAVDYAAGTARLEPARTAVARGRVRSVRLANRRRLTATDPCADSSAGSAAVVDRPYVEWLPALVAPETLTLVEGHNLTVRVRDGRVTLSARPGTGAGEVCEEVPVVPDEEPPDDSTLLTGGPACDELVRTVNGLPGKSIGMTAGPGVIVTADPNAHTVTFGIDTAAFAGWPSASSSSGG